MPIQITENEFIQYTYNPDYLQKEQKYITDPTFCCSKLNQTPLVTDIVLDGGNVIKCSDAVIMTDKIFKENSRYKQMQLINEIEKLFQAELIVIPWDKCEKHGHADGMVRYIDGNRVLINNYCDFDNTLKVKLVKALIPKFEVLELHYDVKQLSKYSWAYINFLLVGNVMLVPSFGQEEDSQAFQQLSEFYSCEHRQIDVRNLAGRGGALNCISWNVKATDKMLNYYDSNKQYSDI